LAISHKVNPGDCFSSLASANGFRNHKTLYEHSKNADLATKRKNPNVLAKGDTVAIPDKAEKEESGATGQKHTFQLSKLETLLRVKLQDEKGNALPAKKVKLVVGQETKYEKAPPKDGLIEVSIDATAQSAKLTLYLSEEEGIDGYLFDLALGALEHESTESGVAARLTNLGYEAIKLNKMTPAARAISGFQKESGLTVDGKSDNSSIQEKLRIKHEGL
jgi:hypothetical protein